MIIVESRLQESSQLQIENFDIEELKNYIRQLAPANTMLPKYNTVIENLSNLVKQFNKSQRQLQFVSQAVTDVIFRLSDTGKIQYISPSCKKLIGYDPCEILQKSFFDFIKQDKLKEYFTEVRELYKQSNEIVLRIDLIHKNGSIVPAEICGQRIENDGKIVRQKVKESKKSINELAITCDIGKETLADILDSLEKPNLDPRDKMPKPILRNDVLKMEDLKEGMVLKGTVRNVVDFGAFVDIGVKQDGLVHLSKMAKKYVKNPLEIVSVGDIIDVKVISIDLDRSRVALSMVLD